MIMGEKVVLRAIEPSDVRQLWEWAQDDEIMRLRDYPSPPTPLALAEQKYRELLSGDARSLHLAIISETGELIGELALRDIDQRIGDAMYTVAIANKGYWGKGYGSDATRTIAKYAFQQLNLHRITLHVHASNERAIRAYEHCGFLHEGRMREAHYMDGCYSDVIVMGLLRQDFDAGERERLRAAGRKTVVRA